MIFFIDFFDYFLDSDAQKDQNVHHFGQTFDEPHIVYHFSIFDLFSSPFPLFVLLPLSPYFISPFGVKKANVFRFEGEKTQ